MIATPAALLTLAVLAVAMILMITEKVPPDGVSVLVMVALPVLGLIAPQHMLDGLASEATMTVACLLVLSAGLFRTGVVAQFSSSLGRMSSPTMQGVLLIVLSGVTSAFINNTTAIAVLLPVALSLCRKNRQSPSRWLMPMSFAAQMGGICTLVGSSTNLLVDASMRENGLKGLGMFEPTLVGGICLAIGCIYLVTVGRFLIPERVHSADTNAYDLHDYLTEMRIQPKSRLIGQNTDTCDLLKLGNLRILEIVRDDKLIWAPRNNTLRAGDVLLVRGDIQALLDAAGDLGLENWAEQMLTDAHLKNHRVGLVEVLITNASRLVGRTLSQMDFYWRYHAAVLGIRRRGDVLKGRLSQIPFQGGDTLLLQGHEDDLEQIAREEDFTHLQELSALSPRKHRSWAAIFVLVGVLAAAALNILPITVAVLAGVVLMIALRCLNAREAYEALDMRLLLMIAGMIPLGRAMTETGCAKLLVDWSLTLTGNHPMAALAGIYLLTVVLASSMSHTATAVLMAPLCIQLGEAMHLSPRPFLIAVMFAVHACFTSPVAYQTNAMVYGPGGYRYVDFIRFGLPLNIVLFIASILLIPLMWPFHP